jgi:hypothetical protein
MIVVCPVNEIHEVAMVWLEDGRKQARCIYCGGEWPWFEEVFDGPQAQDPA